MRLGRAGVAEVYLSRALEEHSDDAECRVLRAKARVQLHKYQVQGGSCGGANKNDQGNGHDQ